jgi:hypothetical protein
MGEWILIDRSGIWWSALAVVVILISLHPRLRHQIVYPQAAKVSRSWWMTVGLRWFLGISAVVLPLQIYVSS